MWRLSFWMFVAFLWTSPAAAQSAEPSPASEPAPTETAPTESTPGEPASVEPGTELAADEGRVGDEGPIINTEAGEVFGAAEPGTHIVSITMAFAKIIAPFFELATEVRILPTFSVSLITGLGRSEPPSFQGVTFSPAWAFNVGLQGRYYVWGQFEQGINIGLEGVYHHLAMREADAFGGPIEVDGSNMTIGPFVGYKHIFKIGTTLDLQIGFVYVSYFGEYTQNDQKLGNLEAEGLNLLLNLNAGWSF